MTRLRVAVLGALGGLLTGMAVTLVFAPGLVLGTAPAVVAVRVVSGADPTAVSLLTTLFVAAVLVVVLWSPTAGDAGAETETAFERGLADAPEAVTDDRQRITAAGLDASLRRSTADGGSQFLTARQALARTAVGVYAEHERVDPATARAAVEGGEWTDDRTAAAFLAEGEPTPTVLERVRLWLTPERERRRRVDRTIAAIRRLEGVES